MIDEKEVQIDTFDNGVECSMTLIHLPTEIMVKGKTKGPRFKLKQKLFEELNVKCGVE